MKLAMLVSAALALGGAAPTIYSRLEPSEPIGLALWGLMLLAVSLGVRSRFRAKTSGAVVAREADNSTLVAAVTRR